jgi:hypothetical protein
MGRFQRGQSGNPGGRPAGPSVLAQIEGMLREEQAAGDKTKLRALLDRIYEQAMAGEAPQQKLLLERVCPAKLALEASLDEPTTLTIVRDFTGGAFAPPPASGETFADWQLRVGQQWFEKAASQLASAAPTRPGLESEL